MKLERVLDEIQKIERKVTDLQEQLKVLHMRRKQLEDEEIIKSFRTMKLGSREMLALLNGIKDGTASIRFSSNGFMEQEDIQKAEKEEQTMPEKAPEGGSFQDGD